MKTALTKFACLNCQRVLKRPTDTTQKICPRCGGTTYRTGSDFKAPPTGDRRAWQVASFLILRIPMKPAIDSDLKPASHSDFIPAGVPI